VRLDVEVGDRLLAVEKRLQLGERVRELVPARRCWLGTARLPVEVVRRVPDKQRRSVIIVDLASDAVGCERPLGDATVPEKV
jgi:hypothetical protein